MKKFVVELVGARGVGKSTLAQLLLAELRNRNLAAGSALSPRLSDKVARHLSTLVDRGRFTFTSVIWRPLSVRDLRTFRKRYRRLRLSSVKPANSPGIDLLDEGVFQLIMELQAKTAQKDIRRIADTMSHLIPFPDLVVVLEDTDDAIEQRRRMRANAGDLLRPRVVPWELSALDHTKSLLADLRVSGTGPDVIVVKNSDPSGLIRTAARLAGDLAARYGKRSGGYDKLSAPGQNHVPSV